MQRQIAGQPVNGASAGSIGLKAGGATTRWKCTWQES